MQTWSVWMRTADGGDIAAAFRAGADAELFARAAAKLGRALVTAAPEEKMVTDEEPMDMAALLAAEEAAAPAAEADALPYPLFYERRQLFFPVAAFAGAELQALASALFVRFDGDGATYPTARGETCLAPLQMATQEFLAAYEDRPEDPQPYDAAARFLAQAARERPLSDERTELEEFLAMTSFHVHRRDFPRWKDIFHLVIKRLKAAEEYAARRAPSVPEEALDAFLADYQTARAEEGQPAEPAAGNPLSLSRRTLRRTHKVLVDADACPVVRLIEKLCERYDVPVALFCDDHHEMTSSYSDVIRVPRGKHAADYAIVGLCHKGDIVVTEDTGLAQLILAKEAYPIAADGWRYTARLPWQGTDPRAARRALHSRMHKRSEADDVAFERGFLALLHRKFFGEEEW